MIDFLEEKKICIFVNKRIKKENIISIYSIYIKKKKEDYLFSGSGDDAFGRRYFLFLEESPVVSKILG